MMMMTTMTLTMRPTLNMSTTLSIRPPMTAGWMILSLMLMQRTMRMLSTTLLKMQSMMLKRTTKRTRRILTPDEDSRT